MRTYSRWIEELGRRETWEETVERYFTFLKDHVGDKVPDRIWAKAQEAVLRHDIVGSMRAKWAAGPAAKADNTTLFNCGFAVMDNVRAFAELLHNLMCGTGQGFRVLESDVAKLPVVSPIIGPDPRFKGTTITDDREGWAESVFNLMWHLYNGEDTRFDYSLIRPAGARLKTMGGRASGPEPLVRLHEFIRDTFNAARGRQLTTLEVHDICCMIAEIVVVGGVRRSSLISLSDLHDESVRDAKSGDWPMHRAMSNNSAVYWEKPDEATFFVEWSSLATSGSGERGISNLGAMRAHSPYRRDSSRIDGVNPCGEISLRDKGFCNLSEVVVRSEDTTESLQEKVELATWLGAIQSTFTNFPYLSEEWKQNAEEERLLGVSITGQMDAPHLMTAENLVTLKIAAWCAALEASEHLDINFPAAITCVKPSGTASLLVDASSGLHPRYAPYYIRRFRISATDTLLRMLRDQGVRFVPEVGQDEQTATTWVCEFPVKAPEGAITRHDLSAIDQLEYGKRLVENWCEHAASQTVYVDDHEWDEVGRWVYDNWDSVVGISFLPKSNHTYLLAPYEECDRGTYERMVAAFPTINYSQLSRYELEDQTIGSQEVACLGGACEI